ncbi:MAG TPA: type IV toxin-antitoxin system AbiEi family antitoxin domain-containing protein [Streptosporangiaceae bacterium]|nr:type IV toxin-antitoxin system AbiEi family antitoxin domain-containing protein [Streptosporangiaceae bacterium]
MITTAGLRAAGLSRRQIRRLVQDGTLRPLLTGVYAAAEMVAAMTGKQAAGTGRAGESGEQAGAGSARTLSSAGATPWMSDRTATVPADVCTMTACQLLGHRWQAVSRRAHPRREGRPVS